MTSRRSEYVCIVLFHIRTLSAWGGTSSRLESTCCCPSYLPSSIMLCMLRSFSCRPAKRGACSHPLAPCLLYTASESHLTCQASPLGQLTDSIEEWQTGARSETAILVQNTRARICTTRASVIAGNPSPMHPSAWSHMTRTACAHTRAASQS